MRHTWSLVAGAVFAPLAWFLIAFGQGAMTGPFRLPAREATSSSAAFSSSVSA
jgi:hypothetical protein